MQEIIILRSREREKYEYEVLAGAADLCVSEAGLAVDNVGADAAERSDVREQCGDEMGAAVDRTVKAPPEKTLADKARKENDKRKECRKDEEITRERQCPETEQ